MSYAPKSGGSKGAWTEKAVGVTNVKPLGSSTPHEVARNPTPCLRIPLIFALGSTDESGVLILRGLIAPEVRRIDFVTGAVGSGVPTVGAGVFDTPTGFTVGMGTPTGFGAGNGTPTGFGVAFCFFVVGGGGGRRLCTRAKYSPFTWKFEMNFLRWC
jgi:hypothetical protein